MEAFGILGFTFEIVNLARVVTLEKKIKEKKLKKLMNEGNTVRVYLPYGDNWYDYSVRRLKENPKMAGYIIKNLFLSIFRIK